MIWLESTDSLRVQQLPATPAPLRSSASDGSVSAEIEVRWVEHHPGMPEEAIEWELGGALRDEARERGSGLVFIGPVERRSHMARDPETGNAFGWDQSYCRVAFMPRRDEDSLSAMPLPHRKGNGL